MHMSNINVQVILMICTTLTCTVSGSIDSKTRILLLYNSSTYETVSAGADVKHISWWGLVQLSQFSDVHSNGNCAVNCPLAVLLTATDTSLYWSRLLPTARKVKWWSSSVVTRVFPSPALDMSSGRKLVLIAPPSGREQSCDVARIESCNKTTPKKAWKHLWQACWRSLVNQYT